MRRPLLLAACLLTGTACAPLPVIDVPSVNQNSRINYLVIHFTSENYAESLRLLTTRTDNPVSAHYLIPQTGDDTYDRRRLRVLRLVQEARRAWHAGDSYWHGETALNNRSIGIELVNRSRCHGPAGPIPAPPETRSCVFHPFDERQVVLLIRLARSILARNPDIDPVDVVGHADIAPTRRADPGPLFPWHRLYEAGIGAWYDESTRTVLHARFRACLPGVAHIQRALTAYGYEVAPTGTLDLQTRHVLQAFRMHFLPQAPQGAIDAETAAVLFALVEKYRPEAAPGLRVGCAALAGAGDPGA